MSSIWVSRGKLLPSWHVCPTKAQQKRNHVQKSFGCSSDEATLDALERKTRWWAEEQEFGEELLPSEKAAE